MLYIEERVAADLLDPVTARKEVLAALREHAAGRVGLSDPRSQFLRGSRYGSYYHLKAAYLDEVGIAGIRLGGFPRDREAPGRMQLMVLSDLATTRPLALIGSEALTTIRVGAAVAAAVEHLRPENAQNLAMIGAGRLARGALLAIQATTPFVTIRVNSRTEETGRRLCAELAKAGSADVAWAATPEQACDGTDVIVTLTNADQVLVRTQWCRPGGLLVSAGGRRECEDGVLLQADRLFVDDWAQCTILGDVAALHREGKITEQRLTGTLTDVIAGRAPARTAAHERVVAVPQGLTILDIALGNYVYRMAKEKGLGTLLQS